MKNLILLIMMLFLAGFAHASNMPVVAITSPDGQDTFTAGSDITMTVSASETGGTIESVSYYNGSVLLGQSYKSPYSFTWPNVPVGTYTLTAVATDIDNVSKTSHSVTVTVTPAPPVVDITSPANNTTFSAGSDINLVATASEFNGTIAAVSFYNGPDLLTTSHMTMPSYNYTWTNVPAGTYTLTVVATDVNKILTTSSPLTVTVASSLSPAIAITSPINGSVYTAGTNITIRALVSTGNGAIREVYFFDRSYYLGSTTESPYAFIWRHARAGNYSLTAEATDSNGDTLISAPVNITVNSVPDLAPIPPVKK